MKIKELPTLWYENKKGEKFIGDLKDCPDGFIYSNSQFPTVLHHFVRKTVQKDEVDRCEHPDPIRTGGWAEGIEGRKCTKCGGTQTQAIIDSWPSKWKAIGSIDLLHGEKGWSDELVTVMVKTADFSAAEAIMIVANACERCMNVLADKYNCSWGYEEFSEEWEECGTSCEFCSEEKL